MWCGTCLACNACNFAFGAIDGADVLSLAGTPCLAQLTCLQLDLGAGLDDFAAVAVACALRDIQRL